MNQEESEAPPPEDPSQRDDSAVCGPEAIAPRVLVVWPLLLSGVVLPLICFLISFPMRPEWQSGNSSDYAQLLLAHKSSVPLYPFLLYCMTCMVLLFAQPDVYAHKFWVRLGIYSGVLLGVEYWLLFQAALPDLDIPWQVIWSVLAVLVPWCVWRIGLRHFLYRMSAVQVSIAVFAALCATFLFPPIIVICFWCSTPWALASYAAVSIKLVRGRATARFRFSLEQLFTVIGWLAAHLAAWRLSYLWMLEEYSRLPTTPPSGCFICTAAAKGHPAVVRSQIYETFDGTPYRVNDQLRYLKALELLLASISPALHRQCRRAYDCAGPRGAALLCHPLLADAAYFLLKPLEWCARACLVLAIPNKMGMVLKLYRGVNHRP